MGMKNEQKVFLIQSRIGEGPEKEAHRWTSTPLSETTIIKKDLVGSPQSICRSLIVASGKKGNIIMFVFEWIASVEIPWGVGPHFN